MKGAPNTEPWKSITRPNRQPMLNISGVRTPNSQVCTITRCVHRREKYSQRQYGNDDNTMSSFHGIAFLFSHTVPCGTRPPGRGRGWRRPWAPRMPPPGPSRCCPARTPPSTVCTLYNVHTVILYLRSACKKSINLNSKGDDDQKQSWVPKTTTVKALFPT